MPEQLTAALTCALLVAGASYAGPLLIARLPEPALEADATGKQSYVALAARPRLGVRLGVVGALVGAVVGARLGWQPATAVWVYLAAAGTVLGYVDAVTRLLPTRLIAPSYAMLVALTLLAGYADSDLSAVIRAGEGWLAFGGFYFVLWFVHPRGLGYGDVRLSGLLGIALGYLGWGELLTGMYAGFLLGGVGGALLAVAKVVDRKRYPFGPFMLLGALVGLVWGAPLAAWYAGR